jgi:YgiT-type zinc finger domain-containing protein
MKVCYFCKGKVVRKKIRHVHHWGQQIFLFEDVPAEVCQQCGETYFSPSTLQAMDRVVLSRVKSKKRVSVPVFSLSKA